LGYAFDRYGQKFWVKRKAFLEKKINGAGVLLKAVAEPPFAIAALFFSLDRGEIYRQDIKRHRKQKSP
jgi:hypothetical protein